MSEEVKIREDEVEIPKFSKRAILFAEDWNYFPTARPDWDTPNRSFVRLAALYKSMGIKNHAFILALVNQDLKGVNPHDPNLTVDQMVAIAYECSINPWYFFREVARAPATSGTTPSFVEANRGNIALWWSFFNHITFILIQIRQTGKSFSTDVLMTYLMHVVCRNTSINLLTKDDHLRRENIKRLKNIASDLPAFMNQMTKDDVNNGEELSVRSLGNSYKTLLPKASPKQALNVGRGLTTPIFQIDEAPFQPNIWISLPAALAATSAAIDSARKNGEPYGIILTTTAGKKDDKDGKFIYKMVSEAADWDEKFFDLKDEAELRKVVCRHNRKGDYIVNGTFNHRQLGKTDEWLFEKLRTTRQTGDDANRDYFNLWTSGSAASPLPTWVTNRISKSKIPALHTHMSQPRGYITNWYVPEAEMEYRRLNKKMILGLDTSDAGGGDSISFILVDAETLETVAAAEFNETNLLEFARWVAGFMIAFPHVTAVIENRSTGQMLIDYLILALLEQGIDPFKRLFNRIVQEKSINPERYREISVPLARRPFELYEKYKKMFGFATSGSGLFSRTGLYSGTLQNAAKNACDVVKDKKLVQQILALVVRNGRIDHEAGGHDDMVIGWLLCHWFLTQGTNLDHYGIEAGKVMSSLKKFKDETPEQMAFRKFQRDLRHKIADLVDQIANEQDEYVCARLELEVKRLDRELVTESTELMSVTEMLRQANEKRRNNLRRSTTGNLANYDNYYEPQGGPVTSVVGDLPPGFERYGWSR